MNRFAPDEVWIERSEWDTAVAATVRARVGAAPVRVFDDGRPPEPPTFADGKRRLIVQRHSGSFLRSCPAGTGKLVCCNYLVVNFASNCPFDCSYCFLQEYLANNPALKVFTNVGDGLAEIDAVVRAHPERTFRIGTGELADSLALDPLTALSRQLVPFAAARPNLVLELKTKSDCVDELLGLEANGRVVVSWSMNTPAIIQRHEPGTASFSERLAAADRVQRAGYRVGFHFDPLVAGDDWEREYPAAAERLLARVDAAALAWISFGSLRLSPRLAAIMRARGTGRDLLATELVAGADGKARAWHGLRSRMYRTMVEKIRARAPGVPIYLCMEPGSVWERVMSEVPSDRMLGMRLAAGGGW